MRYAILACILLWGGPASAREKAAAAASVEKSTAAGPARLAVIIDDFGLTYPSNPPDELWMKLDFPITFAVMPSSPRTRQAAEEARRAGKEVVIHFPFDPFLTLDLRPDSVTEGDKKKVRELWEKSLKTIPGAVGANTHRSYKATRNRPLMKWFMESVKEKGFFFVDSFVSPKTVAFDEAQRSGIPSAMNRIFLDEPRRHTKASCRQWLAIGVSAARKHGSAVVIGHHYYQGTLDCLKEAVPELRKKGVEFVFASEVVRVSGAQSGRSGHPAGASRSPAPGSAR